MLNHTLPYNKWSKLWPFNGLDNDEMENRFISADPASMGSYLSEMCLISDTAMEHSLASFLQYQLVTSQY